MQTADRIGILRVCKPFFSYHLREFLFSSGEWLRLTVVVLPTANEESNLSEFAPQYPVKKNANSETLQVAVVFSLLTFDDFG